MSLFSHNAWSQVLLVSDGTCHTITAHEGGTTLTEKVLNQGMDLWSEKSRSYLQLAFYCECNVCTVKPVLAVTCLQYPHQSPPPPIVFLSLNLLSVVFTHDSSQRPGIFT